MPNTPLGVFYPDGGWTFPPGLSGTGGAFQTLAESIDEVIKSNSLTMIDSIVTASETNQVNFTNIPQGFADLILVWGGAQTEGNAYQTVGVRVNGDTSSVYRGGRIGINMGTGAFQTGSASDGGSSAGTYSIGPVGIVGSGNSGGFIHFPRYGRTGTNKDWYGWGKARRSDGDIGTDGSRQLINFGTTHYPNTGAITSIRLWPSGADWTNGSTFALLGTPRF